MSTEFIALILIILAGFIGLFFMLRKRKEGPEENQALLMLQNQMNEISRVIDAKVFESAKLMQSQTSQMSENMQKIIRDITERLTRVDEGQKQVANFADQLKNLQDILKNPKQRGVLGEYYLETVLKNVLPPESFQMQYQF